MKTRIARRQALWTKSGQRLRSPRSPWPRFEVAPARSRDFPVDPLLPCQGSGPAPPSADALIGDILGRSEEAKRARREGIRRAEQVLALNPLDGRALSLGAKPLFLEGQTERALAWSRRAFELYPNDLSALVNAACLCLKMGLKDEAFEFLERVCALGYGKRDWVEHDPDYDSIRDDPRFAKVLSRLK